MATHDYVIANGSGAAVRSDLNGALAAIASNNSSATEPSPAYAYMWWSDTTTGLLKIRNAANTAWVTVGTLASTNLGLLASAGTLTAALGSASTPGITFTGDLNTGIYSPGADQVAISTGGTGRVFVDSSGRVGVGTASLTGKFEISTGNAEGLRLSSTANYLATSEGPWIAFNNGPSAGWDTARIQGIRLGVGFEGGLVLFTNDGSAAGAVVERARVANTGELLVGKTTVTTNGGKLQVSNGITFPATQVACSDANTLDDYEEGTWTPSVVGGSTAGTATYSIRVGKYTKIGNLVTIEMYLAWSAGTGTGSLFIDGLPFTNPAGMLTAACLSGIDQLSWTTGSAIFAYFLGNQSRIALSQAAPAGGRSNVPYDAAAEILITGSFSV